MHLTIKINVISILFINNSVCMIKMTGGREERERERDREREMFEYILCS